MRHTLIITQNAVMRMSDLLIQSLLNTMNNAREA